MYAVKRFILCGRARPHIASVRVQADPWQTLHVQAGQHSSMLEYDM